MAEEDWTGYQVRVGVCATGLGSAALCGKRKRRANPQEANHTENVGKTPENSKSAQNFTGDITSSVSVISLSSHPSVPYTNYSCQQLNVFIPFCLLYYSTFILLFSTHLFTRRKAYSDRIIPPHNKNKSQRARTHTSFTFKEHG